MKSECLQGLKVADFSWTIALPITTKCLADYGATVVKVESMRRPDILRTRSPYAKEMAGVNRSGTFNIYNSNKYSISLDLSRPEGIELAKKLVGWADVVTENFVPGVMERLGMGYEELKKVAPHLIMVRSSGQGHSGPYASQPGFGVMLQALAGFSSLVGWPDRPPVGSYTPYTDFIAPFYTAVAILAALEYRSRTGQGQCIELSQVEAGVCFLAPQILDYGVNGRVAKRAGNRCSWAAPHGVFRCQGEDRWCAIAIFSDREWEAFSGVCGTSWSSDPRFATFQGRKENEDELERLIEEWTLSFTPEEVMAKLQENGVAAGVLATGKDLLEDPQLQERGYFQFIEHPEMGIVANEDFSFKLSKTPAKLERPSPCMGEHTEYVCREILGLSDGEFIELLNAEVFS